MALDINQLRAAFAKKSEGSGEGNNGFWEKFFPFYKMDFDQVTTIRFLPDLDEDNPLGFIVENKYHELMVNGKKKRIACMKMYGEPCPCCEASQKYYNEGDQEMGKKFWRKIDYIAQCIIVNCPFDYPVTAEENPVRLVSLSTKLYGKVENAIVKGDLDEMPFNMQNGYDFRILKTKQGEYADYSNSDFARKSTAIAPALLEKIELYDLSKYRYGKIEREQMEAMIESFLSGKDFDEGKGGDNGVKNTQSRVDEGASKPMQSADQALSAATGTPAQAPSSDAGGEKKLSPAEILAKLKARQSQG